MNSFFAWAQLLYYARGFTNIAMLVQLIFAVITDMGAFFFLMCVMIVGLSHSLGVYQLGWEDLELDADGTIKHFTTALRDIALLAVLGDVEMSYLNTAFTASLAVFVVIIMTIVMLNLLISIISETYERVRALQISTINKAQAELVNEMELTFLHWIPKVIPASFSEQLARFMNPKYLIFMAPDDTHMKQVEGSTEVGKLRIQLRAQSKQLSIQRKQLKALSQESQAHQNRLMEELAEMRRGQQQILAFIAKKG